MTPVTSHILQVGQPPTEAEVNESGKPETRGELKMGEPATAVQRAQEPTSSPKIVNPETLIERMDAIFHDISRRAYQIFEGNGSQHGHDVDDWLKAERELLCPVNVEVNETDKGVEIKADVQGFNEKELEISVEPTQLTITGKHETSKEEKKGQITYSESIASDILRYVTLPTEIDATKATATLKNGTLNIVAPKTAKQVASVKPKVA